MYVHMECHIRHVIKLCYPGRACHWGCPCCATSRSISHNQFGCTVMGPLGWSKLNEKSRKGMSEYPFQIINVVNHGASNRSNLSVWGWLLRPLTQIAVWGVDQICSDCTANVWSQDDAISGDLCHAVTVTIPLGATRALVLHTTQQPWV